MSSIIGKEFENKSNGNIIKVVSIDGNIAILENTERISVERLLDRKYYGEYNPGVINESFQMFNNEGSSLHNQLFAQINSLSNEDINRANDVGGTSIDTSSYVNPVESHSEAMRKLINSESSGDLDSDAKALLERAKKDQLELDRKMRNQFNKVEKLIGGIEDDVIIPVNRNLEGVTIEGENRRETTVKVVEDIGVEHKSQPVQVTPVSSVNPMFTKMKRTKKVPLNISFDEMMPSKELLKMLEEGFEDSVLDYLTNEIAGKILSDSTIKSQIRSKLEEYVYGKVKTVKKRPTNPKATVVPSK